MTKLKLKEFSEMGDQEMAKKIKDLKLELIKSRVNTSKTGSSKVKQTKRTMAKIFTLNKSYKEKLKN